MSVFCCIFAAALSFAGGGVSGGPAPVAWEASQGGNGHYYQIVPLRGTWDEADRTGQGLSFKDLPGHLVTITSPAEMGFIESSVLPLDEPIEKINYWIGLTDRRQEGAFEWVTGEPFEFANWAEGEPNDFGGGEDFAALRWTVRCGDEGCVGQSEWNDLNNLGEEPDGQFAILEFESPTLVWSRAEGGNGHGYRIVPLAGRWGDAETFGRGLIFRGLEGHLVAIGSREEQDFLEKSLLPSDREFEANYWIGLTDQRMEGRFEWVTGEPVTFTNWAEGEPNNFGVGEDFAAIRWQVACDEEGCRGNGEWNDLADFGELEFERPGPFAIVEFEELGSRQLFFAQFGDGAGLFSKIILSALDRAAETDFTLTVRNDDGDLLPVDFNGESLPGALEGTLPAGGLGEFVTDGQGSLQVGSVAVESNRPVSGVIVFGGPIGLAGVGSSAALEEGFTAPMETKSAEGIDTGVAIMNLEDGPTALEMQLFDRQGRLVASSARALPAKGHLARFLTQFVWDPSPDFLDFSGTLKTAASGRIAATVIQTRPEQFATMPVAPLSSQD